MRSLIVWVVLLSAMTGPVLVGQASEPAEDEAPAPLPKVEVSADGTHFHPAVAKSELPEGAHYCDMGTVHYARMEKGDNTCPICGMQLSQDKQKTKKAKKDKRDKQDKKPKSP